MRWSEGGCKPRRRGGGIDSFLGRGRDAWLGIEDGRVGGVWREMWLLFLFFSEKGREGLLCSAVDTDDTKLMWDGNWQLQAREKKQME